MPPGYQLIPGITSFYQTLATGFMAEYGQRDARDRLPPCVAPTMTGAAAGAAARSMEAGATRPSAVPSIPRSGGRMGNPRRTNGHRRNGILSWLRSLARPCWICGLPIDYGAPQGDPRAMECDELVPVSRGGSPFDRENVAAAHRCCNNWRRTKPPARVSAIRVAVAEAFGPCSTPEEFVARAKAVESGAGRARLRTSPKTTTDW